MTFSLLKFNSSETAFLSSQPDPNLRSWNYLFFSHCTDFNLSWVMSSWDNSSIQKKTCSAYKYQKFVSVIKFNVSFLFNLEQQNMFLALDHAEVSPGGLSKCCTCLFTKINEIVVQSWPITLKCALPPNSQWKGGFWGWRCFVTCWRAPVGG